MTRTGRRAFIGYILGGMSIAAVALSWPEAIAAPLPIVGPETTSLQNPIQEAAVTCWWSGGRRVCRHHPVRRVCWWSGGRRVCRWR